LRETPESWVTQDSLLNTEIQLKSVRTERQPVREIINSLDLRYKKNRQEDDYDSVIKRNATRSQNLHGVYSEVFEFDLVRDKDMAVDLANFYIDQYKLPSTFFNVTAYLKHFALEKTDVITVDSAFGKLNLQKAIIRSVRRNFGSGKNRAINTIDLLLESINWTMLRIDLTESVTVLEEIIIANLLEVNAFTAEELSMAIAAYLADSVTTEDSLESEWIIKNNFEEPVTVADSPNVALTINLSDDVIVNDNIFTIYDNVGFNTRPFNADGFGGVIPVQIPLNDSVRVEDEITVELS
jgi:hypothetical protein